MELPDKIEVSGLPSVIGGPMSHSHTYEGEPINITVSLDIESLLANYDGKCVMIVPTREKHENQEAQKPE